MPVTTIIIGVVVLVVPVVRLLFTALFTLSWFLRSFNTRSNQSESNINYIITFFVLFRKSCCCRSKLMPTVLRVSMGSSSHFPTPADGFLRFLVRAKVSLRLLVRAIRVLMFLVRAVRDAENLRTTTRPWRNLADLIQTRWHLPADLFLGFRLGARRGGLENASRQIWRFRLGFSKFR
jgi:hypothetical protein